MGISCGLIILAAGSSGRLGRPKQLLPFRNSTLLQHLVNEAKTSSASEVILVLGANATEIRNEVEATGIKVVTNTRWKEGMASSIVCGINAMQQNKPPDAVILMACDQPFVSAALLNNLITTHLETGKPIITSGYDKTMGPPALFHKTIYPELLELTGDRGAKKIIEAQPARVVSIAFPEGNIDIDTASDYAALTR